MFSFYFNRLTLVPLDTRRPTADDGVFPVVDGATGIVSLYYTVVTTTGRQMIEMFDSSFLSLHRSFFFLLAFFSSVLSSDFSH